MIKTITLVFLCNIISVYLINAKKCYVCDGACDRPGAADLKDCSDAGDGGTSGKTFVYGALKKGSNASDVYSTVETDLNNYAENTLLINKSLTSWKTVTQWSCYTTQDKRRGCVLMPKGLCVGDKTPLAQITEIGDKVTAIMANAKKAVSAMFGDSTASLNSTQKESVTNWFAENYMAKLINNSNGAQYQLDSCCDNDACNFASMIQISTAVLSLLVLSTLILI